MRGNMEQNRMTIITLVAVLSIVVMIVHADAGVVGSKHDLSASGPGPMRSLAPGSGGTSEICVFCHTPHTATPDAPLWNRSNPVGPYTTYVSDVLSALSYTVEDPLSPAETGYNAHVKTRICMSCHDGTIALGSLVNLPEGLSSPIQMQGTAGGMMPSSSAGYIGTNLRDDHPVAVKHDPGTGSGQDPELQPIPVAAKVRLYNTAGVQSQTNGDYVECTSCHDPHDDQFGKFLIEDNISSTICSRCHNKEGDDSIQPGESAHSNTANFNNPYSPPNLGSSVQNVKCMDCHFPHKSGVDSGSPTTPNPGNGMYLTSFREEQTCYNNTNRWGQVTSVCHGAGATTTKNIESEFLSKPVSPTNQHRVGFYTAPSAAHNAAEGSTGYGWLLAGSSWHVECADCHNAHTAGSQSHPAGTNAVTATQAIYGAGGVRVAPWPGAWNAPGSGAYFYVEPIGLLRISGADLGITAEYQLCLKCHSSFAWGAGAIPQANMTDQSKEFNTNNASYHPVTGLSPNTNALQWVAGSGFGDTSLMYCSDCHGNSSGTPAGPHASAYSAITVSDPNSASYGSPGGFGTTAQRSTDLCFKCHPPSIYNTPSPGTTTTFTGFRTGGNLNLHNQHAYRSNAAVNTTTVNPIDYKCVNCHIRVSHGWHRKALIVIQGDGAGEPWNQAYEAGGVNTAPIAAATLPAAGAYGAAKNADCTTANGCHQ